MSYRVTAAIKLTNGVPTSTGPVAQVASTLTEAKALGARFGVGSTIGDKYGNRTHELATTGWRTLA